MAKRPTAKTKPNAPGASAATPKAGHNSEKAALSPAAQQALFMSDKGKYERSLAVKKKADADFKNTCKAIKSDGFTVEQIKAAIEIDTPEGEARVRANIAAVMLAARFMNSPIGAQFELFMEPDRTPSVDRAYDDGKKASASNQPAQPPYDPSVPQYQSWLSGYHDHQRELAGGLRAQGPDAHADTQQPGQQEG